MAEIFGGFKRKIIPGFWDEWHNVPSEVEHLMGPGEIKELERKNYIEWAPITAGQSLNLMQLKHSWR